MECFCPYDFLERHERDYNGGGKNCEISFGSTWPDSIGKEDKDWRSCNALAPTFCQATNHSCTSPTTAVTTSATVALGKTSSMTSTETIAEETPDGSGGTVGIPGPPEETGGINWEKVRTYRKV